MIPLTAVMLLQGPTQQREVLCTEEFIIDSVMRGSKQIWWKEWERALTFFANSTKISPPLGQLQPPWGLRTALGHLMGNKSKCERRGRRGRRAKVISMIRQEGQDRNKSCNRRKTSAKGKTKQIRKNLQFWNWSAKLKNTFCVKYVLMAPWVVPPSTMSLKDYTWLKTGIEIYIVKK